MPNLLAMSFEGELAPSFDLVCLQREDRVPDGWGLGYYPGGEPSAAVLKEPAPPQLPQGSIRSQLARAWEHLEASLFVLHIRNARWGANTDANTQPFVRSWGRRDWMLCHAGSLSKRPADDRGVFEPIGSTDSEQVFCTLMNRFAEKGWRSIADLDLAVVRDWLDVLDDDGSLTLALSDGRDLLVYVDRDEEDRLHLGQLLPPYDRVALGDDQLVLDLTKRGAKARKGVLVSSEPLHAIEVASEGAPEEHTTNIVWQPVPGGHLLVIRQGTVIADVGPPPAGALKGTENGLLVSPSIAAGRAQRHARVAQPRTYDVVHRTVYRYAKPVERSSHVFRLTPRSDRRQLVLAHTLNVSQHGQSAELDDVFDNRVRRLVIDTPWTEMIVEAKSTVRVLDVEPLDVRGVKARSTIPLVWMPWQRQIMAPYLLPPELPESQLDELSEYAMTFVKRNDFDLLDTLLDINQTIFKEYAYRQGSTTVFTTAFEVYANRRGVCQDFTNLFICLARLLGVPARYACGYVFTGDATANTVANKVQSEASHAWVQLYLPEVGWKGFDPTNGILTQTEHVRVAVGRNYMDATPTAGTIYVGGGPETLEVSVLMTPSDA